MLRAHCERVGRDEAEIDRSIHLSLEPGEAGRAVATAQEFFDAGVDIVVWSWRGELDPGRLDALATAIDEA